MPSKRKSGVGSASASTERRGKAEKLKEAPAEVEEQQLKRVRQSRRHEQSSNGCHSWRALLSCCTSTSAGAVFM
ncbi:hypothetical protein NL676_021461 [Syzygium grande]|nr:hypothetical protein NL676_021461 [Syzygium grande]